MSAICNGMFAYGGMRPYCATFLNFAGYALGAIRLSALSKFGVVYVMTHDSIGLGEDGPTHQPIEMIESLRSMPNCNVVRPCDEVETRAAYRIAVKGKETPTVICLSRQTLPYLDGSDVEKAMKGGYVIKDVDAGKEPDVILVGTGSETGLCVQAADMLKGNGVNAKVVSMVCMDIFDSQTLSYKKSVLNDSVPVIAVEAASAGSWSKYSHVQFCMTTFGASAKGGDLMKKYGFTAEEVARKTKVVLDFYSGKKEMCAGLLDRPVF